MKMRHLELRNEEGEKRADAYFNSDFVNGRVILTCTIVVPHGVMSGSAVCHPKDACDRGFGYKLAFKRALESSAYDRRYNFAPKEWIKENMRAWRKALYEAVKAEEEAEA